MLGVGVDDRQPDAGPRQRAGDDAAHGAGPDHHNLGVVAHSLGPRFCFARDTEHSGPGRKAVDAPIITVKRSWERPEAALVDRFRDRPSGNVSDAAGRGRRAGAAHQAGDRAAPLRRHGAAGRLRPARQPGVLGGARERPAGRRDDGGDARPCRLRRRRRPDHRVRAQPGRGRGGHRRHGARRRGARRHRRAGLRRRHPAERADQARARARSACRSGSAASGSRRATSSSATRTAWWSCRRRCWSRPRTSSTGSPRRRPAMEADGKAGKPYPRNIDSFLAGVTIQHVD